MSSQAKAMAGVLAVVVAVGLFLVLRSDSSDDSTETAAVETEQTSTVAEDPEPEEDSKPAEDSKPETQKPEEPEVPTIVVESGQPVGGVQKLSFTAGDDIRFVVESDVDEEVHLHGYDVSQEVTAGGRVEFDIPATLEGVFEVELEESVVPIAEISVNPA